MATILSVTVEIVSEDSSWQPSWVTAGNPPPASFADTFYKKDGDWHDAGGVPVPAAIPVAGCGNAVWKLEANGSWKLIANNCSPGCEPVSPLISSEPMPVGLEVTKPCQ